MTRSVFDDYGEHMTPIHAAEVAVTAATAHECVLVFLEILVGVEIGGERGVETKTVLNPIEAIALPWATARGLRDALSDQIGKYERAIEGIARAQERPN